MNIHEDQAEQLPAPYGVAVPLKTPANRSMKPVPQREKSSPPANEAIKQIMKRILTVIVCCLICGCEITNTPQQGSVRPTSSSTFVHSFTKLSFPESIGTFHRVNVQKYDQEGKDVGVGYNSSIPIAATVFVYPGSNDSTPSPSPKLENPGESLLNRHFEACKQNVLHAHPDAKLISEGPGTIVQGKNRFGGKKAVFSLGYKFGPAPQKSVSELYVFLIEPNVKSLLTGQYFVTYRITYPTDLKSRAEKEISSFLSELKWPAK
jgi:hypothetical protein